MKFKTLLITFIMSLFFLGIHSSANQTQEMCVITYVMSAEVSEQLTESEDNRNLLQPTSAFIYATVVSSSIIYEPSFFST